jgi:polyisoprenoid-binding protein YceI
MEAAVVQLPDYVAATWAIDPTHSYVGFVVRHLMIAKVRGHFTGVEGTIITAPEPLASSVTAAIDLASVSTGNTQRDAHLRSADFLEAEKFPTMSYRSTAVRSDGHGLVMDGELTLKDVTRPVSLKLEVNGFGPDPFAADPLQGGRAGFTATGEINRMDFGVSYNGPIPGGGMTLGEKVDIVLEIEAARTGA